MNEDGTILPTRAGGTSAPQSEAPFGIFESHRDWLGVLRRYIVIMASGNLIWEFAHLPLYTIWTAGTASELAFAAVHCTGGDILIALSAIMLALFLVGSPAWPAVGRKGVIFLTVLFGLAYTLFSEWLNIEVREAWAYRGLCR